MFPFDFHPYEDFRTGHILALSLSKNFLNCTGIYTDSESAYKLIRRPKRLQPSSHAPLVRILQHFPPQTRRLVQHIHSHSEELTQDKSRWTQEMYINHLADSVVEVRSYFVRRYA